MNGVFKGSSIILFILPAYLMSRVQRHSKFYQSSKQANVKEILNRLTQADEEGGAQSKAINEIIEGRLRKIREHKMRQIAEIHQGPLKPARSIEEFSHQKPISSGEKFLLEKKRMTILSPERSFSTKPNMRAGSIDFAKMMTQADEMDPAVVSQKFEEYLRVLKEQSGACRRKRLADKKREEQNSSLPMLSPAKQVARMKRTYFKKYASDQYNFYRPPVKNITRVFELTSQRASIDSSRTLLRSKASSVSQCEAVETVKPRMLKKNLQSKTLDVCHFGE